MYYLFMGPFYVWRSMGLFDVASKPPIPYGSILCILPPVIAGTSLAPPIVRKMFPISSITVSHYYMSFLCTHIILGSYPCT